MEERNNEMDKTMEDVMMPGFRFHPTDEELVDFYLRRKIQQKCLPIELIKQVDIYKYDPWDLPKLASSGEKEWYFYCPRDRKYRNSVRPNRVTKAGFWKATGTDRPIYSSEGKCIGLKKSLVFYRGRAAKGIKTDWMMHEFRLPSLSLPKKDNKTLPPSDSWAICRIFKKTNSISMAQKALSHYSHPWITQMPEARVSDLLLMTSNNNNNTSNMSCTTSTTEIGSASGFHHQLHHQDHLCNSSNNFSKPSQNNIPVVSNGDLAVAESFIFSTLESSSSAAAAYIGFEGAYHESTQGLINMTTSTSSTAAGEVADVIGFPFSLPPMTPNDAWKVNNNLSWDSPTCPTEISTTSYSANRC